MSSHSSRPPEPAPASGWAVIAAGTVGFDDISTPAGRQEGVPGGSALYFTLAARPHCRVWPVAAVGDDGMALLSLLSEGDRVAAGIARLPGPSYRWRAVHDPASEVPIFEEQAFGVYSEWHPLVPEPARASEILFLGSMAPRIQLEVLPQAGRAKLIAIDTMRDFIGTDRPLLLDLIAEADLLFANGAELAELSGHLTGPAVAARSLLGRGRLRGVVVKLGAEGAALVTRTTEHLLAAHPVAQVVDPTGAGDALAGGTLGRLAQLRRCDEDALVQALSAGMVEAARAISRFGVSGLGSN